MPRIGEYRFRDYSGDVLTDFFNQLNTVKARTPGTGNWFLDYINSLDSNIELVNLADGSSIFTIEVKTHEED